MDSKSYYEVKKEIKLISKASVSNINKRKMEEKNYSVQDKVEENEMCWDTNSIIESNHSEVFSSGDETLSNISDDMFNEFTASNISIELAEWCVEFKITDMATDSLLKILQKYHHTLPRNSKTLKSTSKTKEQMEISPLGDGFYCHIGLESNIKRWLKSNIAHNNVVKLDIGIDGIPLAKSSNSQLWPILGNIIPFDEVFVIGIFHGHKKPICANQFLQPLVEEISKLQKYNIRHLNKEIRIEIRSIICDAPARSFILGVKSHSGYFSCTKCQIKGTYLQNKVCFPGSGYCLRTDEGFRNKIQRD